VRKQKREKKKMDVAFYTREYEDLMGMSEMDAVRHYQNYGKYEGRFKNKKEKDFILESIDIKFYTEKYGLTEINSLQEINSLKEIKETKEEEIKKAIYRDFVNHPERFLNSTVVINFSPSFYEKEYGRDFHHYLNYGRYNGDLSSEGEKDVVMKNDQLDFGFIIICHINSERVKNYIVENFINIRRIYGRERKIVIIYDNCEKFSLPVFDNVLEIESEYPGRGELLAYYYFYKYKFFSLAVIIHDSTFIRKKFVVDINTETVKYIWHFDTEYWGQDDREKDLISYLRNNDKLLSLWNDRNMYKSCFGVQSIISYNFVSYIQKNYDIFCLLQHVSNRSDRCLLERIFGLICYSLMGKNPDSIYGNIHEYQKWLYSYDEYIRDRETQIRPIIKVFTGR
jgi:hypothetical protein